MNGDWDNGTMSGRRTGGGPSEWAGTMSGRTTEGGGEGILLAGRYRVVKRLGEGGMGSVWLAEDTKLDGRKVAVKMLPSVLAGKKGAYRQVKAEALMAMKLSHPNIATVRGFEEDEGGNPFLVMDYIEGEGLDDILTERGPLGEEETVRLLGPVAAALDYAHSQGVVHRDVKPGNVLVRRDGKPFVLDFGIAREIQETMTRVTGKMSSGTLLYMSPEQLNGDAPKPTQDVYSFAAMAYECLAGEPPFARGQIEWQIMNKTPEALPGSVDEALRAGVMAGLAKEPVGRPESCAGVLGRDEAEKREREKRAAEEAERLRRESLLREQERARAEAERQARASAEAKAEKARREAEKQADAARRERAARSAEASKGKGWMALAVVLGLAAIAGAWVWWQTEEENRRRGTALEEEMRTLQTSLESARQEADAAKKQAAANEEAARESADTEKAKRQAELKELQRQAEEKKPDPPKSIRLTNRVTRMAAPVPQGSVLSDRQIAELIEKGAKIGGVTNIQSDASDKAVAEQQAKAKAEAEKERGAWDGVYAGEAREVALPNGEKMRLHWCPAGRFTMGSPEGEDGRKNDEMQHRVTLTQGFWMAETEVTQGQWKALMNGETIADLAEKAWQSDVKCWPLSDEVLVTVREAWRSLSTTPPCGNLRDDVPVYYVSWNEAREFCRRLTQKGHSEGWLPVAYQFRLPTEAEWEYACRAGTTTALPNGKDMQILGVNNAPALDDIAWYGGNSSVGIKKEGLTHGNLVRRWPEMQYSGEYACTRKTRGKAHNSWGLYDMIGNVLEWCEDKYAEYPMRSVTNYVNRENSTATNIKRVVRGGSWMSYAHDCRSAFRDYYSPGARVWTLGFRLVCSEMLSE